MEDGGRPQRAPSVVRGEVALRRGAGYGGAIRRSAALTTVCLAVAGLVAGSGADPAAAADCSPAGLPSGARVVTQTADVLVWDIRRRPDQPFPASEDTDISACAKPAGAPVALAQSSVRAPVTDITVAGLKVKVVAGDVHAFRYAIVVDAATGAAGPQVDLASGVVDAAGDLAGVGLYRRQLQVFAAGAIAPTVADLAAGATGVTLTPGRLRFTQSGRAFAVDLAGPAASGPPHPVRACAALTSRQARAAGGSGTGSTAGVFPPYLDKAGQCRWGALTLTRDPPMNASQRAALVGSAAAAGLGRARVPGASGYSSFTASGGGRRVLWVVRGGSLVTLELRGVAARHGGPRLVAAARQALRALGWR